MTHEIEIMKQPGPDHPISVVPNSRRVRVTFGGKTIADVLNMPVEEGVSFFGSEPAVGKKIEVLEELGLGYLTLGQSATTLSGG